MNHYLLVYDRSRGELIHCTEYADARLALRLRFELEKFYLGTDVEVVVLGADSLDVLKRTHARYFFTVRELAERALAQLA